MGMISIRFSIRFSNRGSHINWNDFQAPGYSLIVILTVTHSVEQFSWRNMTDSAPAAPKGGKQAPKVAKKGEKRAGKKGGKIGGAGEKKRKRRKNQEAVNVLEGMLAGKW